MKRVWVAAMMALLVASGAQAKEWKNVRIGIEGAYPPFLAPKPTVMSLVLMWIWPMPCVRR